MKKLVPLALFLAGCSSSADEAPPAARSLQLAEVASGFPSTTEIRFVPGSQRLVVVLQQDGALSWVDLSDGSRGQIARIPVSTATEQGLLGIAFHPDFETNRLIYINYTVEGDQGLESRISELRLSEGTPLGAAENERILITQPQPGSVHKGAQLQFGPDGFLYIGFGDGGADGNTAQDLDQLLGKILRIDVDGRDEGLEYAVPGDNPFTDGRPEIWALGLRNPWRFSFDPEGRLIVADVGHRSWEEIDIVTAGGNYGWPIREGAHCAEGEDCATEGLIDPVHEYSHELGNAITGGVVYEGSRIPSLQGMYLFTDFGSGRVWALELPADGELVASTALGNSGANVPSIVPGPDGELYLATYDGRILRLDGIE